MFEAHMHAKHATLGVYAFPEKRPLLIFNLRAFSIVYILYWTFALESILKINQSISTGPET